MAGSDVPDTGSVHREFHQLLCRLHKKAPLYRVYRACGNRRSVSGSSGDGTCIGRR